MVGGEIDWVAVNALALVVAANTNNEKSLKLDLMRHAILTPIWLQSGRASRQ